MRSSLQSSKKSNVNCNFEKAAEITKDYEMLADCSAVLALKTMQ